MKRVALALIALYQKMLSPLLPKSCRFYPSCSEYAKEAIKEYGAVEGTMLAVKRISKCHPFSGGGMDLVPIRSKKEC